MDGAFSPVEGVIPHEKPEEDTRRRRIALGISIVVLCQVVGHKYVRLFAASETRRLYPRSGALCNNSCAKNRPLR